MKVLARWLPGWAASRTDRAAARQPHKCAAIPRDRFQLTAAKPCPPIVAYALATPVKSSVTLHGTHPATAAFSPATRAVYAPPVLRRLGQTLHAVRGPAREVSIFGADGDVLFSYTGHATGQGATCNFYPARTRDGNWVGLLEYRIGNSVINAGPQARAIMDVAALERQVHITRMVCPELGMSEPVVVDDLVYVSAKLMDASLSSLVRQFRSPSIVSPAEHLALVRCCMRQVLRTLAGAKSMGVYHRDIKPDNILVSAQGAFLTTDWGQAYSEHEPVNVIMGGTAGYAPPEHTSSASIDVRGDMFSVGVTLAELLGAHVRDLPAAQADKNSGTCGGLHPVELLRTWCDSRTDAAGGVRWQIVQERAQDRREELLLRNVDRFALDAHAGCRVLTDYLFAHLLRFDVSKRHTPDAMLAWIAERWPDEGADLEVSKRILPKLLRSTLSKPESRSSFSDSRVGHSTHA